MPSYLIWPKQLCKKRSLYFDFFLVEQKHSSKYILSVWYAFFHTKLNKLWKKYQKILFFNGIELYLLDLEKSAPNQQWYFVTKVVLTYSQKKLFEWSWKTFEIRGWRPRICKCFEITRTIYSNSARSDQFLVTECFLTCSWRFLISNKLEQLIFKLEKIIGIQKHAGKVRKS